jgi:hypothetical protein
MAFVLSVMLVGCGTATTDTSKNTSDTVTTQVAENTEDTEVTTEKVTTEKTTTEKSTTEKTTTEKSTEDTDTTTEKATTETTEKVTTETLASGASSTNQTATTQTSATTQTTVTTQAPATTQTPATTQAPATTEATTQKSTTATKTATYAHKWVEQFKTVSHKEVGHYETKYVTEYSYECGGCGKVFRMVDELRAHQKAMGTFTYTYDDGDVSEIPYCSGYSTVDAQWEDGKEWVVDTAAYDEKVSTGFKCSKCGATSKSKTTEKTCKVQ